VIDLAGFRTRGPEFRATSNERVQAALDAAEARTDATFFGDHTDSAHFFLAAHLLVSMPQGKAARVRGEGFRSLYLEERERLERMCGHGAGLALGGA
jgi:hypothetical protein